MRSCSSAQRSFASRAAWRCLVAQPPPPLSKAFSASRWSEPCNVPSQTVADAPFPSTRPVLYLPARSPRAPEASSRAKDPAEALRRAAGAPVPEGALDGRKLPLLFTRAGPTCKRGRPFPTTPSPIAAEPVVPPKLPLPTTPGAVARRRASNPPGTSLLEGARGNPDEGRLVIVGQLGDPGAAQRSCRIFLASSLLDRPSSS